MIEVLYEDNHIIAVNKKPSDIVQGDKTGDVPLVEYVKEYIKKKYNKPGDVFLQVVHRLDRPTSGVVLFARTSKSLVRLNEMLREREIKKTYYAVVKNMPPKDEDTLVHFLRKNEKKNMSGIVKETSKGCKKAELTYKLISRTDNYVLLQTIPITGRHHQIRVQLASIGCPIKGDLKYRFPRSNKDGSIHLHAQKVEFIHPVKKEKISIVAPPPQQDTLWRFFEELM